ncbi:hypothetical protein AQUCO_01100027v1 [Aquilegia coerulea]|uniref:RNase H type-1 domain-containing protein n=1 Tax=Aquilegia coerulea TaxID=218851 RepID=A0A2G5E5C9_AQUCA|nr:hypothetical protein AQUCO_01100027v1 [Aquilegia coerulea]
MRGMMKINVDGASRGNPDVSGWGVLFRGDIGQVKLSVSGLGVCTSYEAGCSGILESLEIALHRGWTCIMIESDSQATVEAFFKVEVPWYLKARWRQLGVEVLT